MSGHQVTSRAFPNEFQKGLGASPGHVAEMFSPELFTLFSQNPEPPSWYIEDLLESPEQTVREQLRLALKQLPTQEIIDASKGYWSGMFKGTYDHDLGCRLWTLSRLAERAVSAARLTEVLSPSQPDCPRPYNHPALRDLVPDAEGLVSLDAFELHGDTLRRGGYAFMVLASVPSANAAYWLLLHTRRLGLYPNVRVRLDPFIVRPEAELPGTCFLMNVYGRPLDWERIRNLRDTEHGRWLPDKTRIATHFTDYAWRPSDDEVVFVCEELPAREEIDHRGSRYLHAVYKRSKDQIVHLDGAIRWYDHSEYSNRVDQHLRTVGKTGRRVKIFRIDTSISREAFEDLAPSFFVWNYDVAHYFGAS